MARIKTTAVAQRTVRSLWQRSAWGPTLTPYQDHCLPVFIGDSHGGMQTFVGEISWFALVDYCTDREAGNYVIKPIDSPPYLSLPAADYEPQGVKPMLAWIQKAYDDQSLGSVLPADLFKPGVCSLLDLCCIARAFTIFGTYEDFQAIRSFLLHTIRETHLSVYELSDALRILPRGSYWAGELLDHIYQRYKRIGHSNAPQIGCCGGREHPEGLEAWIWSNAELLNEMNRRRCEEIPAPRLKVSETTKHRIEAWMLEVDDKNTLPVGTFPHPGPGRKAYIPTLMRLGDISGTLRLEWLEENGGCYLETHPRKPMWGMLPYGTKCAKSTEVSRLWLASRGYGSVSSGEDCDGFESSIEVPEVARVDSGVDCSMPGAWPFGHR